jgi:adenine-specific DNA glycosylase
MNLKTIIQANSLKFNHINFYFCQQIIIMKFSKLLIQWYLQNKRDLPWRNTKDPYRILRNHVTADPCRSGNPYFLSFVDPTVFDLANADEEAGLETLARTGILFKS